MIPLCKEIRKDILRIARESGHGHIPTCFSIVEILYAVYASINHDPVNPDWNERDIFILSKGHGALAQYCVLARLGYFDIKEVYSLGAYGSCFGGHADRFKVPGVEASTGSLGHGIGIAIGIALAFKIQKNNRRVFTVIGDGESNEGSSWEAVMVATDRQLNNLTIIYDNNMSHGRGLQIRNPGERLKAFGCDVIEVDGHDIDNLKAAFTRQSNAVKAVVANTKKGFGCPTLVENHYAWHRRSPDDTEFELLMRELDAETI
jgi:transketolase